jgi:uncharacterized protein (TIGR02597 family)
MKTLHPFIWVVLTAISVVRADIVVTSPAVGYQRLTARGASDSHLSVPLVKRSSLTAHISAVGTNSITLSAATFADGAFSPDTSGRYYVQFVTGNLAGLCFPISGSASGTLSLETADDLTSHPLGSIATDAPGDMVRIRPFWSVADILGSDTASLVLDAVENLPAGPYVGGDAVFLPDNTSIGTEKKPASTLYYVSGDGWRVTTDASANAGSHPLPPGQPFVVRRHDAQPAVLVVVGDVPSEPFRLRIPSLGAGEEMDFAVALARPPPTTLAASGLFSAVESDSVFNASAAILEPGDALLEYYSDRQGFALPPERRYHVFGTAWFEVMTPADDHVLRPGEGYVLRLRGERPTLSWKQVGAN